MISLDRITMQFGGRFLFRDVSVTLGPHERTGLVGPNGSGKSTLLKIIAGSVEPEKGRINKAHYVTAGYLPQDGIVAAGKSLYHEAETAFEDILEVQQELQEAGQQLSEIDPTTQAEDYAEIAEIYGELQYKLEGLDAFRIQAKIEQVLLGLGFKTEDFGRDTAEFSGGWQMRIALAKLLLKEPSLLLLDEPTNHLDLDSLQWLEEYLLRYHGAIVLVSHDRRFLDSLTRKTLALHGGEIGTYAGNYSFYERERAVRKELQVNAFKNQQKQLKHTQEFIDRFRYKATKARQVQSRIKQLEKIEMIEIEDEEEEIHFHFPAPPAGGVKVLELRDVAKSYGSNTIFSHLNFTVERGDRIAVVGVNGAGKSTFSRLMAGTERPDSGERILGHNVILSYFAQHQAEELDPEKEVLEILDDVATGEIRTKLRTILGAFLFHGDDVFKHIRVLSGGEKSRVALAKMLIQPSNMLVMDEPTNHLDMKSKKVLQEALISFAGSYLIVSHDRAFLDPLVNKVLEISPGRLRVFLGSVSDYIDSRKKEAEGLRRESGQKLPAVPQESDKERKRREALERQELSKKLKPYREQSARLEKEIGQMEKRKSEIESIMGAEDFFRDGERVKEITHEYKSLQARMQETYRAWENATEKIREIEGGKT